MQKRFFGFLSILLICLLAGCTRQEAIDFGAFADRAAALGAAHSILDYSVSQTETGLCRMLILSDRVSLRVFSDESGTIDRARLVFLKLQPDGGFAEADAENHQLFFETAVWTLGAFCGEDAAWSEARLSDLQLDDIATLTKRGELRLQTGAFDLVYVSTAAESVLSVSNRFLLPMETTHKPESRPAFDETTFVRTETVPHK